MAALPQPPTSSAESAAQQFGTLVRARRKAQGLRQEDLALVSGVGRRFIIDLEAGKPTCYLGHALLVASALGLRFSKNVETSKDDDFPNLDEMTDDASSFL